MAMPTVSHEFRFVAPQGVAGADRVVVSQRLVLSGIQDEFALVRRRYPEVGFGPEEWIPVVDLEPVSDEYGSVGRVKALLAWGDTLIAQGYSTAAAAVYGCAAELDSDNDAARRLRAFALATKRPYVHCKAG